MYTPDHLCSSSVYHLRSRRLQSSHKRLQLRGQRVVRVPVRSLLVISHVKRLDVVGPDQRVEQRARHSSGPVVQHHCLLRRWRGGAQGELARTV